MRGLQNGTALPPASTPEKTRTRPDNAQPDAEEKKPREQAARDDAIRRIVGTDWAATVATTALPVATLVQVADSKDKAPRRSLSFSVTRDGQMTTHQVMIPRWEFFGVEQRLVSKRFVEEIGDRGDEPFLFLSGDLDFSTNAFLPGRLSARTFDSSPRFVEQHLLNLQTLRARPLKPTTTAFFNLVAPDGTAGESARWNAVRAGYDRFAEEKGISTRANDRRSILDALADGHLDTIVIVGHGDAEAIYLPDGSKVTVRDVLELPKAPEGRRPVVILVACETGRASRAGAITIAQALLMQGRASAVVAPTRKIPAAGASLKFLDSLFGRDDIPAADVLKNLGPPWQLFVTRDRHREIT